MYFWYSLDGREFIDFIIDFNVDLILLGMLLFSTRISVFCAIVLIDLYQTFCMLYSREGSSFFSYSLMCS